MPIPANYVHLEQNAKQVIEDKVPGDFAEFGVWYGYTFMSLAELARQHNITIHAVDSFEGMPNNTAGDGGQYGKGKLKVMDGGKIFMNCVRVFNNAKVHKGYVPQILSKFDKTKFAFVHLDIDQYQTTLDALRFLWPRMNKGGILQCHDWMPKGEFCASKAIKEWMAESGVEMDGESLLSGHIWFKK